MQGKHTHTDPKIYKSHIIDMKSTHLDNFLYIQCKLFSPLLLLPTHVRHHYQHQHQHHHSNIVLLFALFVFFFVSVVRSDPNNTKGILYKMVLCAGEMDRFHINNNIIISAVLSK